MHVTLHLTNSCNMRCTYCYAPAARERQEDMSAEVAERAVLLASASSPANTGVIFFGGEPLLKKELIRHTVAFCREHEKKTGSSFHFKVTTNGLLLDREFLEWCRGERVMVSLSIDGLDRSHDRHRRSAAGRGTFRRVAQRAALLLRYQPYACAFATVTPETVPDYAESVDYLFSMGFRYIIASLDFAGAWSDAGLAELKRQYRELARWYEARILAEDKFYFSPFEKKFASHIQGKEALCQQCHFGVKQVSVAPDGSVYPCVQFVQDGVSNRAFAMGDVWCGIDRQRQTELVAESQRTVDACSACSLTDRCEHRCSCLNWQTTGEVDGVSPLLCEHERLLIPIVDRLGERLFRKRAGMFIQKHYNAVYPLISFLEDRAI